MSILMSDSLKQRISEKNLEKQMTDSVLINNVDGTKIKTIKRSGDIVSITLESDIQLLNKLYDFSIGMVREVKITSQDLNLDTQSIINYNVIGCKIDYNSEIKKIKITLIAE